MLNLLRMNFYRAIHDKGLLVIFILVMTFITLSSYAYIVDTEMQKDVMNQGKEIEEMSHDDSVGIMVNTPVSEGDSYADFILYYSEEISSGIFILFGLIALVIFFRSEEKDGYIKNIAGQTKYRLNIYFSKFIVIGVFIYAIMLLCIPVQFLILKIYAGDEIKFGIDYLPEFLCTFSIQFLLCLAFLSGVAFVTAAVKSTTVSIVVGVLASMGTFNVIIIQLFKIFHIDFDVFKYFIMSNIYSIKIGVEDKTMITAIIVGFAFFIVYNIAGVIVSSKRDIV